MVLEEYALGRLAASQADAVEAHVQNCPACARELDRVRRDAEGFRAALCAARQGQGGESDCPPEETLALYLDRSLGESDRQELEGHLSACRRCQRALVAMYREVKVVADPDAPLNLAELGIELEPLAFAQPSAPETVPESPVEAPANTPLPNSEKRRYLSQEG